MADFDLVIRGGSIVDGTGRPAFNGDLAVKDGLIAAVGTFEGTGNQEIEAVGLTVTPGFVDIHTHYDAQATWDPYLTPSSLHGVTTVVMGNCGVGFAPCKEEQQQELIDLMEAVEDIPGIAMTEGLKWEWETFPEYMDALEKKPLAIDVGVQVPHCAVRVYTMGQRGIDNEAATQDDIEQMKAIVKEGMDAGALGFSTSRTDLHNSKSGDPVPGTFAAKDELFGIAEGITSHGGGIFQIAATHVEMDKEFAWMKEMARDQNCLVTFNLQQIDQAPNLYKKLLSSLDEAHAEGITRIRGQHSGRPVGVLMGWQASVNPFITTQAYLDIANLPWNERLEKLRDPVMRHRIINDDPMSFGEFADFVTRTFDKMYPMRGKENYEPSPEESVAAIASAAGQRPEEVAYDAMLEQDGLGMLYFPLFGYSNSDFSAIEELLKHPHVGLSLADGGAHVGMICDGSTPTFMVTHWTRDRTRGDKLPLEQIIKIQTKDTAAQYGLSDRGVLAAGMKADINVIDLNRLRILPPTVEFDLPAGGKRLYQIAEGYRATIVNGRLIYENGKPTGELPGRLIRGPQEGPNRLEALAAE